MTDKLHSLREMPLDSNIWKHEHDFCPERLVDDGAKNKVWLLPSQNRPSSLPDNWMMASGFLFIVLFCFFIIVITPCVHYLRLWTSRLVMMRIRNTSTEPWLSEYSVRNVILFWTIPLNRPWQARSLDLCYGLAAHASYAQTLKWYLNILELPSEGSGPFVWSWPLDTNMFTWSKKTKQTQKQQKQQQWFALVSSPQQ